MSKTVTIDYVGRATSAVLAAKEVAAANEAAAAKTEKVWSTTTKTVNSQFGKLGGFANTAAGLVSNPWLQAGATVGAAGAAIIVSAVKAADAFDAAHASMVQSAVQAGDSQAAYGKEISSTDDKLVGLGFTMAETEGSIARLTAATKDVGTATKFESEAADLARFKHESLADATNTLVRLLGNSTRGFVQLGISLKDTNGVVKSHTQLMAELSQVLTGQANAYSKTLPGAIDVFKARFDQLKVTLGHTAIPALTVALKDMNVELQYASKSLEVDKSAASGAKSVWDGLVGTFQRFSPFSWTKDSKPAKSALDENAAAAAREAEKLQALRDNADNATFAFLGLASSVKTASQAFAAVVAQDTTAASSPYQLQLDTSAAQASADALHGKIDSAVGGGGSKTFTFGSGGTGSTFAAAVLDQTQKELGLRDAQRAVADQASQVNQAETQLAQAREARVSANLALTDSEKNYEIVLHGVAAGSIAAANAIDALSSAKNAAAGSKLDVQDAQRALAQARNDRGLSGFAVTDAQLTLTNDQAAGADPEKLAKDQIALNDARIAASSGDEAVKRAELALADARIAAGQKTRDLAAAHKLTNDTLHGYPPISREAKQATLDLKDAHISAKSAAEGVTTAIQSLQSTEDNAATNALNLKHAQEDLSGELTKLAGAGGGIGKLETKAGDLITKLDDLRTKSLTVATDLGANVTKATGSLAAGFGAEINALQTAVDAEPLLKGAFDTVLTDLRTKITQIQYRQGINPTAGGYTPGEGPNRNINAGIPTTAAKPNVVIHNHFHGPVMGADVASVVHKSLKDITATNGFVAGVRTE